MPMSDRKKAIVHSFKKLMTHEGALFRFKAAALQTVKVDDLMTYFLLSGPQNFILRLTRDHKGQQWSHLEGGHEYWDRLDKLWLDKYRREFICYTSSTAPSKS